MEQCRAEAMEEVGCSNGGRGGHGRGRGLSYSGRSAMTKKGLCASLGTNVFDYGTRGAPDQMRQSWEKLMEYVGTTLGQDIANEVQNKTQVNIPEPVHDAMTIARETACVAMITAA